MPRPMCVSIVALHFGRVLKCWHRAVLRCVRKLLQRSPQDGSTALIHAAASGHADCALLLLDAGADRNIKNNVRVVCFNSIARAREREREREMQREKGTIVFVSRSCVDAAVIYVVVACLFVGRSRMVKLRWMLPGCLITLTWLG